MLTSLAQPRILVFVVIIACLSAGFFFFGEDGVQQIIQHLPHQKFTVQLHTGSDAGTTALSTSAAAATGTVGATSTTTAATTSTTAVTSTTAAGMNTTTTSLSAPSSPEIKPTHRPKSNDGALKYGNMTSSPRILQTSMLFQGMSNKVSDRCLQTHLDHGVRHGYKTSVLRTEFMMINEDENDEDARKKRRRTRLPTRKRAEFSPIVWDKPLFILSTLIDELSKPIDEQAEWIVYVDIDTILLNPAIPWSTFLPPNSTFPEIHFLGSHDWSSFNAGVFILRVHPWSVRFLNAAIAVPVIRPDVNLYNCIDQNAMKWVLSTEGFKEHALYQPSHWWNGMATPWRNMRGIKGGDMLVHFAGAQKFGDKTALIEQWLDGKKGPVSKERDVELNKTWYQEEVEEYWENHWNATKAVEEAEKYLKKNSQKKGDKKVQDVQKKKQALETAAGDYMYTSHDLKRKIQELDKAREVNNGSEGKQNDGKKDDGKKGDGKKGDGKKGDGKKGDGKKDDGKKNDDKKGDGKKDDGKKNGEDKNNAKTNTGKHNRE